MRKRKIGLFIGPLFYGFCVTIFLFGMYFIKDITKGYIFNNKSNLEYVDGEIIENKDNDIPVINTTSMIVRPYLDENVKIVKNFYDYTSESKEQENAIIYYENTYMQNSGIDYANGDSFDVISILDGTVISVEESDILGTTIEIRHSSDLISVYQGISNVSVKKDDTIIQGQIIAKSGESNINKELGSHLHFELYHNGKIVNPEEYYNKYLDEI